MAKTPERDALAGRIAAALSDEESATPKSMFGAACFMVRGKLVACAGGDGTLLLRVAEADHEAYAAEPDAATAIMGERSMGAGWITVAADSLADDERLAFWLDAAMRHNASVTRPSR